MAEQPIQAYPFVTRDMLAFKHGLSLSLRVSSLSNVAGTITIRGATREGIFTYQTATDDNGQALSADFPISDMPIFVTVSDSAGTHTQGTCLVQVLLVANGDVLTNLATGLVYGNHGISWPQNNTIDSVPNGGKVKTVQGADPAAGSEFTIQVPDGEYWRIIGVTFQLVCAAAAANRRVHVVFNPTFGLPLHFYGDNNQIISQTRNYTCAIIGVAATQADAAEIMIPIPAGLILQDGETITSVTTNLNGGDQFFSPSVLVEQFWLAV